MKNMKFDQFYKRKWINILKRTKNFRLRRAKQTTNREINDLKFVSAKIIHMAKSVKKTLAEGRDTVVSGLIQDLN